MAARPLSSSSPLLLLSSWLWCLLLFVAVSVPGLDVVHGPRGGPGLVRVACFRVGGTSPVTVVVATLEGVVDDVAVAAAAVVVIVVDFVSVVSMTILSVSAGCIVFDLFLLRNEWVKGMSNDDDMERRKTNNVVYACTVLYNALSRIHMYVGWCEPKEINQALMADWLLYICKTMAARNPWRRGTPARVVLEKDANMIQVSSHNALSFSYSEQVAKSNISEHSFLCLSYLSHRFLSCPRCWCDIHTFTHTHMSPFLQSSSAHSHIMHKQQSVNSEQNK